MVIHESLGRPGVKLQPCGVIWKNIKTTAEKKITRRVEEAQIQTEQANSEKADVLFITEWVTDKPIDTSVLLLHTYSMAIFHNRVGQYWSGFLIKTEYNFLLLSCITTVVTMTQLEFVTPEPVHLIWTGSNVQVNLIKICWNTCISRFTTKVL